MDVKRFYQETNSNYQNAISIMMMDSLIERMVTKFMNDNSLDSIISLYEKKDYRNLFAAIHTFKGVTGNLALTSLYELSCTITELIRNSDDVNIDSEINELKKSYNMIKEAFARCS